MTRSKALVIGGLAGIGLLALAQTSILDPADPAEAAPRPTPVIELHVDNDQFVRTDVGAPGVSVGDEYAFSDDLYRNGQRVGNDGGSCQVTHVDGNEITTNCTLSLRLPEGQLTAQGLWVRGTSPLLMAVTGGTGAYRNVHGELRATDIQTPKEAYRITLAT